MSNAVVIKGTTYGFSVFVDEQADFVTQNDNENSGVAEIINTFLIGEI